MKTFLRIILVLLLLGILGFGGFWIYSNYFGSSHDRTAMSIVPADAIYIVETQNLSEGWQTVSESPMWQNLIQHEYFADIQQDVQSLDEYLKDNTAVEMVLKDRSLYISAHMISGIDYDFLFVVDLKKISKLSGIINEGVEMIEGFTVTRREFEGEEIVELEDNTSDDVIYLSLLDNLLAVSFSGSLIEKAIQSKDQNYWENNPSFMQVANEIGGKKLFSFYFNYALFDKFAKVYLDEENDVVNLLGQALSYSAMNMFLEDDLLSFDGYTNLDSVDSYLRALAQVEPDRIRAQQIISDQAASYISITFDNSDEFFANLKEQYSAENQEDYESYTESISKVEKFLKIDLQESFFNWIGNEIALVKMRPTAQTRAEDVVVAIHTNSLESAKIGMDKILKQVRRRSPLKFDVVDYKGFKINYLNMKGFFKLFLGKLFDDLEKPFFTYVEDFVVLSNSQQSLQDFINDYLTGQTLAHNEKFMNFMAEFDNKSNIAIFVQMPKIYQNLYYYSRRDQREDIQNNKELILNFARVGFQLESQGNGLMRTTLLAQYDSAAYYNDDLEQIQGEAQRELFLAEYDSLDFKILLSEKELKTEGPKKLFYSDSIYSEEDMILRAEGAVKDGKIFGLWRSYYPSGNIKSAVNYENGKVNGLAIFYYDRRNQETGEPIKKAEISFENDQIIDEYREFYDNGTRKALIEFKNGEPHGSAEFYHTNGVIRIEGRYKRGEKHGRWKIYDENGEVFDKERWRKGRNKDK